MCGFLGRTRCATGGGKRRPYRYWRWIGLGLLYFFATNSLEE